MAFRGIALPGNRLKIFNRHICAHFLRVFALLLELEFIGKKGLGKNHEDIQ